MKKISFIVLLTVLAVTGKLSAQSESYTPWQLNCTIGYANPSGEGTKGGVLAYFEPMFHINDHLSIGFRTGIAGILKEKLDPVANKPAGDFALARLFSYLATCNYYFQFSSGAKFRPYAGVGMGYAEAAGVGQTIDSNTGFGGMARVGFDVGHFCLNAEYTLNPKTSKVSSNYFGINIGLYFGGGSR